MEPVINIAGYQFATLESLKPLRERLLALTKAEGLRGTILLSNEGINLFVAGSQTGIDRLLVEIRSIPGLAEFSVKVSQSEMQPFNRMLVRIKREIIAFGVPEIQPAKHTSPKLPPEELRRWLDEGRPVTLLDTRNEYEVKLGTFKGAMSLGIDHFRHFPEAVEKLPAEMKQQPIVMFCTGGIRCEKAGPYMERQGFRQIFQLDGGILQYFEDCGGKHYQGECFVFDQRVGVDPSLSETGSVQCFECLMPLSPAEQQDPRYVPNVSCPHCYQTDAQQRSRALRRRQQALEKAVSPLPGSVPYENFRPLFIAARFDRWTLLDTLAQMFGHRSREEWREVCVAGLMVNSQQEAVGPGHVVRAGERYLHRLPEAREPDVNPQIVLLHEDEAIVVVNKPAPLPLHPCGRFNRNTLQSILNTVYSPQKLRPAHRLDANTTGVVVLARTRHFAGRLQPQFARGEVQKRYLARVQGHPAEDEFVCEAPISQSPGELGSRTVDAAGLPARTHFRVVRRYEDGTALLEVRPDTGRTNQIRVHLWQKGWPIVGDQTYTADQKLGETQTHDVESPPLCLHALSLTFKHPSSGEMITFSSPPPDWAEGYELEATSGAVS